MINKRLKNTVEKLVAESFTPKGEIQESLISKNISLLKKLPYIDAIPALKLYQKGLKREISKTTLEIFSPVKLSPIETQKITTEAKKTFKVTSIKMILDTSLLGGLRIKIGDVVFDDSVCNKIEQIRETING